MKELKTFGWYASKVSSSLPKESFQPVPTRLLGGLAYLAVVISSIVILAVFQLSPLIVVALTVILGFSYAAMGFLGHEILHGTVVRTPWLRNFLGAVFFWPLCTGPRLWRKWHNIEHHIHTQDEAKDPDAWPTINQAMQNLVVRWVYKLPLSIRAFFGFLFLSIQFSLHSLSMFKLYLKEFTGKNRSAVIFQLLLPWLSWFALLLIIGLQQWVFAFLLPLLIANLIVMSYISTNHRLNPLVDVNDPLANSLTVTVPKWLDILHFNFSYHTEHHLFPAMNPKFYPLVKEQILARWPERYHQMSLARALITLWKTPRVYHEKRNLIDPHGNTLYETLGNGLNPKDIQSRKL
ncbi:acyl-CoA desaturase [Anaerobacillus sp. CMMVII]|uniref:fatty acid desaturase family protein n=1 Tax=Anaerobacillus sp. CMMVII TaxID=2755588 RepID=UPI0021B72300|nr:acyl-CoA desaturase [Anaerobacillus sp. CMMVII]MCT8139443.1 acyl-CoA desaturase [Anaerobacillus sp. CMMVII]